MGQRGPKSAAHLSVVVDPAVLEPTERPRPPAELDDEAAEVWRSVVGRMPCDWFGAECFPILSSYCRLTCRARRLAQMIGDLQRAGELDPGKHGGLMRTELAVSRTLATLASSLRVAPVSQYDKSKRRPTPGERPWNS